MPQDNLQKTDLIAQITKLKSDVDALSQNFYKNNFSSSQTTTRLQIPHYTSAPSVGVVGDIIEVGGKAYICTTAGNIASPATFTLIGSQT